MSQAQVLRASLDTSLPCQRNTIANYGTATRAPLSNPCATRELQFTPVRCGSSQMHSLRYSKPTGGGSGHHDDDEQRSM